MLVVNVTKNEALASVNDDPASGELSQAVLGGVEGSEVSGGDQSVEIDAGAEGVEGGTSDKVVEEGSENGTTGEGQADATNEGDSSDQGAGGAPDVMVFSGAGPAKGGEGGEGGVDGLGVSGTVFGAEIGGDSPAFLADGPTKGGEGGVAGQDDARVSLTVSNSAFVRALAQARPQGAALAVCVKAGDPTQGGWRAQSAIGIDKQCPAGSNNYVNTSAFWPETDGSVRARQSSFAGLLAIVLDDVGTKVPRQLLMGIEPTWEVETSPGNSQVGYVLSQPITDVQEATKLQGAFVAAGLSDPGATGAARWVRLPVAVNGKNKYRNKSGQPWACKIAVWNPDKRFTPEELLSKLGVVLDKATAHKPRATLAADPSAMAPKVENTHTEVYTPKAGENPVVTALTEKGLYKRLISAGKHDVSCPWVGEHTDAVDTGAAYFEPSRQFPTGGFCCQHSHGSQYRIGELLDFLGVDSSEARHKASIRLIAGEMNGILEAAELVLIERGNYYQAGGLVVSIKVDPKTGDPTIRPVSEQALTQELAASADWEKFDGRSKEWVRTDPPTRHVSMLYKAQQYKKLPVLQGVTRQPYFREEDGHIVTVPGYDAISQRLGVFDAAQYVLPEPTFEAAQTSLALLREVLCEFHFAQPYDEAAALSGMFTAVLRPSIELAPGYHAKGHSIGSGKTLLCEAIGAMAGPGGNRKLSYPKTSEEASKVILSALLEGPAVVEFDDMDSDWLPHGVINRMLTSSHLTERILGSSKVATVSTRTLFLGSGNNVGPVRDLLRRVITITLDPRCATPATLQYKGDPLEMVRKNRAELVCAVITIVRAWQQAGSPKSNVPNIASYGGAWSNYCRHPLIWLGVPDPATALFEQLKNDPDREALGRLLSEWYRRFGSAPTTVRKVISKANELAIDNSYGGRGDTGNPELLDAICEFPVAERGVINSSKFGWFLKRNVLRIVDGLKLEEAQADGRKAWRVVDAQTPPSPALPACEPPSAKTDAQDETAFDPLELI